MNVLGEVAVKVTLHVDPWLITTGINRVTVGKVRGIDHICIEEERSIGYLEIALSILF